MFEGKPPASGTTIAERRAARRHMSVFLLAKVTAKDQQALGRVINLSQTGAKLESRLSLTPGDAILLEIRSDLKVAGTVRWADGRTIGAQFDHEVDVGRFLSREVPKLNRVKPRPPRYVCEADAAVAVEAETTVLKVRDVSLSGAGLSGETDMKPGDDVLVTILGLTPRRAKVIWSNTNGVGITFLKPLDFRDFESWLGEREASPLPPRRRSDPGA